MPGLSKVAENSISPGLPEVESTPETSSPPVSGNPVREVDEANLEELAVQILHIIPADGIAIALRYGTKFVCLGSAGNAPEIGTLIEPGVGLCGACILQRQVVAEQEIAGELGSLVAVPINKGIEMGGCIAAFSAQRSAFREIDIQQLVAVASHLEQFEFAPSAKQPQDSLPMLSVTEYPQMATGQVIPDVLAPAPIDAPLLAPSPETKPEGTSVPSWIEGSPSADAPSDAPELARQQEPEPIQEPASAPQDKLNSHTQPSTRAAKEDVAASLRELLVDQAARDTGYDVSYETEKSNKKTLEIVFACILFALLAFGLVRLPGYQRHIASFISKLSVSKPEPDNQEHSAATSKRNDPIPARPAGNSKAKRVISGPAMVVEESVPVGRVPDTPDLEPPSVAVPASAPMQQIPIVVSKTLPTLTAAESPYKEARLIHSVEPKYPNSARKKNIAGNVELELMVLPQGKVGKVRVISGPKVFASAAVNAARQWRYIPAELNGRKIESKIRVTIKFAGRS